jgi:spermidine synthase
MTECWEELGRARTSAGDELILRRRAGIFEIRCNGYDLMSNRAHRSEEALAQLALEQLRATGPHILVGGLGLGFTLRAALDAAPPAARVTVCELLPEIVAWNHGPLAPLAGRPLDDPRVKLRVGDIAAFLAVTEEPFDAILLDVDNGPDALSCAANDALYSHQGLARLRQALAREGVLAVWSADPSPSFEAALDAAGWAWRAEDVAARGVAGDPLHVVYTARWR